MSENYVLQMVSSSTYAFFQSAIEVPHCSLQHLSWDTTNFVLDSLFQFIQCPWPSHVDPILKVAAQKKIINGQIRWSWGPGNVTESWDGHGYRTVPAQLPLIALQCAMSHRPVETRLREVVENCSVQVQQKIAASQHKHFKSSRFFVSPCIIMIFMYISINLICLLLSRWG